MSNINPPTIFVIVGPTAVGKTSFAIALAKALQTEIISADSRQCYQELGIAVAKPSDLELASVPHHFINSHSINDTVNAGVYETYALQKAAEIFAHHPVAVMVGGTGLYIKSFCEGMDLMPTIEPSIRTDIIESYNEKGIEWLQKEVAEKDPAFWATAEQNNPQRLMRALEIWRATGTSVVQFRLAQKKKRSFNIIKIGLELPRNLLYERINQRVMDMVAAGLVTEAKNLLPFRANNALQTVGYQELFDCFDGKISEAQAVELIQRNSRHYAKRQMTWFKKDTDINWFDARTISIDQVLALV